MKTEKISGIVNLPGKKKILLFSVLTVCLVLAGLTVETDVLDSGFYEAKKPSKLLLPGSRVTQEFSVSGNLTKIAVKFGNYARELHGTLRLTVAGAKGVVFFAEFPGEKIQNNMFTGFAVDPGIKKGKYRLEVEYTPADKSEKLSVWMSKDNRYARGQMFFNGKAQPGDLVFRIYYRAGLFKGLQVFLKRFHVFNVGHVSVILFFFILAGAGVLIKLVREF